MFNTVDPTTGVDRWLPEVLLVVGFLLFLVAITLPFVL